MAPEVPNYIEQAKLNLTSPEEVDILKDPSKFDEAALRKMYKDRLDKAAGGKVLSAPLLRKYQEALKQIDENIKKLMELKAYATERLYLSDVAYTMKEYPVVENSYHWVVFSEAFSRVDKILKNPPKQLMAYIQFDTRDKKEFTKIRDGLTAMLDKYYDREVKNLGKKEMERVNNAREGGLSLVDYMDLENEIFTLQWFVDEKFVGSKNPGPLDKMAKTRITEMKKVLDEGVAKLPKDDKFAVENFARATKAKDRKEKNADQWWNGSLQYMAMRYSKQYAERNRNAILAQGGDVGLMAEANKLFEQAKKKEKTDYKGADDLFMKAREKYIESRNVYVAQQEEKKKKKGQKKVA